MGADAGRRIGSMGDALNSMGANAEAVVRDVETNVVSDELLDEAEFWAVPMQCRGEAGVLSDGCGDRRRRNGIVCSVSEVKGECRRSL